MTTPKRLGLNPEVFCAPLFRGLAAQPAFACTENLIAQNALALRAHDLDAAFLTPIDYGRESSDYLIVPDVAVTSAGGTRSIVLCFKEGLHTLKSIATHPAFTSEIVLANILLGERFDVRPRVIPVDASLDRMLALADAALLVGNTARLASHSHANTIDLVEEWNDMTDLPYVHGFWCMREDRLTQEEVQLIQQAARVGSADLDAAVSDVRSANTADTPESLRIYLESFTYAFGEIEQESLSEFLRYAYYHGILPDVADINLHQPEDSDSFDDTPSLN
jgi:chorismate dehydratase